MGQLMRPSGCKRKGARPRLWALPVLSPVSQCMLLFPGLSSSSQPRPSLPPASTGPSKPDFPRRRASQGGSQPGTGGRQGRQWKAEEASEPASEPREGAGLWPVTELKIVLPRYTGLGVQPHSHSWRMYFAPTNKYTTSPLDFNGIYSLMLWLSCINKTLKNVEATHFMNQFNNMLFLQLQWT